MTSWQEATSLDKAIELRLKLENPPIKVLLEYIRLGIIRKSR